MMLERSRKTFQQKPWSDPGLSFLSEMILIVSYSADIVS